ncbi:protein of unknown function [Clostridium beijerinckii]|nr:protein of unknown function [Clostridium beijerinckii]
MMLITGFNRNMCITLKNEIPSIGQLWKANAVFMCLLIFKLF